MTETTTKTKTNILVVPSAWIAYEVDEEVLGMVNDTFQRDIPNVAVMEALVMVGKAKRLAAVHTFNSLAGENEDEEGSPFTEGDEDD